MIAYLFPGQGSQKKGMGKALFDEYQELVARADAVLGYSLKDLCLSDPQKQLNLTQYTQPVLYTINAMFYQDAIKKAGSDPDLTAGHSLGEYNALLAAGVFDFETGLQLVRRRGALMAEARDGGMAAIIGLNDDRVAELLKEHGFDKVDMANYNSPTQLVISGPKDEILRGKPIFEGAGARMYAVLKVSAAFHSRYMEEAARTYAAFLDGFSFADPKIPVISNVTARPHEPGKVKEMLVAQITRSVKWTESIRYLMGLGVTDYEEVGPGNVLKKLNKVILAETTPLVVEQIPSSPASEDESVPTITPAPPEPVKPLEGRGPGSAAFCERYGLAHAYLAGSMYRGISSTDMVVRLGRAGLMGFFGSGGLEPERVEAEIRAVQQELKEGQPYGMNLYHQPEEEERMDAHVALFLKYGIRNVEASGFIQMTPALLHYAYKGIRRQSDGSITRPNRVLAKVSRPETATLFLSPAPERVLTRLVDAGKLTADEAGLAGKTPVCTDLIAVADSGWNTDMAVMSSLIPAMIRLRDNLTREHGYTAPIHVGCAGGIGTPEAAAAAFILGAEFIQTGSINQCTVEAGTSDTVKALLQNINIQDTEYAPAYDLFEMGTRTQVLKKGLFFPMRANRLREVYRQYNSLAEIDARTGSQLQEKFFKKRFSEIAEERGVARLPQNKSGIATVFRWYLDRSVDWAISGDPERKVNYQVFCGPAMGAFNQWVKGTEREAWQNRHVDDIALYLITETAALLNERLRQLST